MRHKEDSAAQLAEIDAKIKAYYDGLTEAQREEEAAWGKLGESALTSISDLEEDQWGRMSIRRMLSG
jgi:hypothetical protein